MLSKDPKKDAKPGLDYCIIPVYCPYWTEVDHPVTKVFRKRLREHFGDIRLLGGHGDGTFQIPDGNGMYEFSYRLIDEPEAVLADAKRFAEEAIERNKAVVMLHVK